MKDPETYQEIEDLLRMEKPRVTAPPDLEERILSSIDAVERTRKARFWAWLVLPAAAAVGVIMLRPLQQSQHSPVTRIEPVPVVEPPVEAPHVEAAVNEVVAEERRFTALFENPLEREARALRRDARRAGHFLINALPSLSVEAE
ncbi:hypothetical protein JIN84_20305 [Luteolibacter yonseiensis]|uniref:Uncharacterized protein n=1 Tax=Luteolibacter yonseiensis TaxID=1144680 RepID=A0A934R682_9BACT|nr:hypothetical protein [Luteolibacter yonseiensis]MBK1817976.1 hypothetical protein [Luteolibacter yonseiensis]